MNKIIEENFEDKWQKIFDGTAKNCVNDFEKSAWTKHGAEGHEQYFFLHFNKLQLKKGAKILDVGCGAGTYTQVLSDNGYKVCGIDFSKEMIKIAKKRDNLHRITYQQSNIYYLPFPDGYFDMVICIGVFQTVQNYKKALTELYRLIKPGGIFYLNTLNQNSIKNLLANRFKKNKLNLKRYYYSQLCKVCREIGFPDVKVKGIYYFHPNLKLLENFLDRSRTYKFLDNIFLLSQYMVNSFVLICKK